MGLMHEFLQECGNFLAFKHVVDLMIHATRKQRMLINRFHLLETLQSGERFLCWNSYKKPGQASLFTQNLLICQVQSKLALQTSTSGIGK